MLYPVVARAAVIPAVAVLWCALAVPARAQGSLQPRGWDRDVVLATAPDLNPDPHVVEVNLDARVAPVEIGPGERVNAWTYNGGIPGPLIRAHAGDRLVVHFTNHLPEPTTVHWHGIRVPIEMDGVPDVSQPPVPTGGTFTYDFVVPDAGLFWYHPHVMSAAQVGFGLYGALLVDDQQDPVAIADETVLVLSDIGLDGKGGFEPPDSGGTTGMAFGREGNHLLVNGRERPRLVVRSGAPERWRVVNAAKSRFFQIELEGQPFTRIGGDGGLLEYPVRLEALVLAPGERADLIVAPKGPPGSEIVVRAYPFNRGFGSVEYRAVEDLMTIAIAEETAYTGGAPPAPRRKIEPTSTDGATNVAIDFTMGQRQNGAFEYGINGVPFAKNHPVTARPGETQIWTITNKTKWSHPFHLHGFFFQVLDEKGRQVHPLEWKDTVNVPFDQTVRLVVRYDDRPGAWMFHCHVLDHADGGLMGMVELGIPASDHSVHSLHPGQ
jgi:FtsP/CotA-like multicopper oxidase with cupredoxin domain